MHPSTDGILESSLYVADVARSAQFYERIFGFRVISDFGGRGCAIEAGKQQEHQQRLVQCGRSCTSHHRDRHRRPATGSFA